MTKYCTNCGEPFEDKVENDIEPICPPCWNEISYGYFKEDEK